jgi:magnesium transporter
LILKGKEDFLLYRILDAIIDNYISVIEDFEDKMDEIDEEVLENPTGRTIEKVRMLIRQIRHIHRIIRGQRDVVDKLERSDTPIIKPETRIYFRDAYDHTISLLDWMENIRENAEGALEVYHSSLANKMNEIMKMLTTIATIFIPLTFLAGVYGMNFRYMPELEWRWGYFMVLFLMAVVGMGMVIYVRKKKWL